jgi:hypothetical protein
LAVVAELLAGLKGSHVRNGQLLAAVATALKDSADQIFVLPGKAAKQNGDTIPLLGLERPLYRAMKMGRLVQASNLAEPGAFRFEALFDFLFVIDLYEMGSHYLPPANAAF